MKQWSYSFNSEEEFAEFVKDNDLKTKEQLLVQVNCGILNRDSFKRVKASIKKELPQAVIAGASSVSQLYNGQVTSEKIVLSITHFEKSRLSLFEYTFPSFKECNYSNIVKSLSDSLSEDTKGILLITNSVYFDIEKLITYINKLFGHIPIFGGIASDNKPLYNFTIFSQNKIYFEEGLIAVIFSGESLQVSCNYFFDWEPIGKEYTVTKADGRYLSELDGESIIDVYGKYFGHMDRDRLLKISLSHPLIRTSPKFGQVARALLEIDDEKGLFTGEFKEGEKVQIGFGNYKQMVENYEFNAIYKNLKAEVVWFYVCLSYNYGYLDILERFASSFKDYNQQYGLMTFGEFSWKNGKNIFLNYTLSRVALSEDEESRVDVDFGRVSLENKDELLVTLSTLVASSSREIVELNRHLEEEVKSRTKELEDLNRSLKNRIELEVKKNREKDKILFHQSKLASMGEMINNIAHQWRQPLNIIALVMQNLAIKAKVADVSYSEIISAEKKIGETLKYLSDTIDDFRSFISDKRDYAISDRFGVCKTVKESVKLLSTVLENDSIDLVLKLPSVDREIKGSSNDLKQILLNIIYNAMDALKERGVEKPTIKIEVSYNSYVNIIIKDNGGGIDPKIIDKIFEPYFTTKHRSRGTGLGLYMSKMIVEKRFHGKIKARNTSRGALFWIELPIMA